MSGKEPVMPSEPKEEYTHFVSYNWWTTLGHGSAMCGLHSGAIRSMDDIESIAKVISKLKKPTFGGEIPLVVIVNIQRFPI